MATQYIGARYVPKFYEGSSGTDWTANTQYEPLTIVTRNGNSYTSKKAVPASIGAPESNADYWASTGIFNAQLLELSDKVSEFDTELSGFTSQLSGLDTRIVDIENKVNWYTPEDYGAVGDGETDDTAAFQNMFAEIPDNSLILLTAPYYKVSSTINITQNCIRLCGLTRSEYRPSIVTTQNNGDMLYITGYGFSANDVLFRGPALSSNGVNLINFNADNQTNDGNIDAELRNCGFLTAKSGVNAHGRNVRVFNCILSNLYNAIVAEQTTIDTDNRGYAIIANRFHDCRLCFRNNINNVRTRKNIVIAENFCDICDMLFDGYGGGVTIQANILYAEGVSGQGSLLAISADNLASTSIIDVITDNVISGRATYTNDNAGILCRGAKIIATNNTFQSIGGAGIVAQANSFVIARNNVLNDVAKVGNYALEFAASATGLVKNNTISNSTHTTIIGTGMTIADNDVITTV